MAEALKTKTESNTPAPVENVNVGAAMSRSEAEIKSAIFLANKFPRDEARAFSEMKKALDRASFSECAVYSFPRADRNITGPSVNMSREFARLWGNIAYGLTIISDIEDHVIVEGWGWDMQTNTKVTAQASFKKLIYRKNQGWISPDERDLRELINKHGAIAMRNALLQLFPRDMIDDLVDYAFQSIKKNLNTQSIDVQIGNSLKNFADIGVIPEVLEGYLEKSKDKWTIDDVVILRTLLLGIKNGEVKKQEIIENARKPEQVTKVEDVLNGATTKPEPTKASAQKPAAEKKPLGLDEARRQKIAMVDKLLTTKNVDLKSFWNYYDGKTCLEEFTDVEIDLAIKKLDKIQDKVKV